MKKVYICHEFGGIYDNAKKVTNYLKELVRCNENIVYISPILTFGVLYDQVNYDIGMDYCIELLKNCDLMITFGKHSESKGCIIEKIYCENHKIPIIDYNEFIKNYSKGDNK